MKTQTICLFLIFTLPTAGCDWIAEKIAQHKAEEERRYLEAAEKTRQDRLAWAKAHPIVGNLGGVPVSLPQFVVEYVSYDDTPEPFSKKWKTYKIPEKRTYQDNLEGFGFVFDFKTNELRKHFVNYQRWAKESMHYTTSATHTWVDVSVFSGNQAPQINMNEWSTTWLPKNGYYYDYKYSKTGEEFGLEKYQFPDVLDKKTQKPIRDKDEYGDTFISRDTSGNVTSVIKCNNEPKGYTCSSKFCNLRCKCFLQIPDLKTRVTVRFRRPHLKHWQKIQQQAEQHIRSWVVTTEPKV